MRYLRFKLGTLLTIVATIFLGCKENNNDFKNNKLDELKLGQQEYIGTSITDSESVIVDTLQWKSDAELYLEMKDGDSLIIDADRPKATKMIKSDKSKKYETFVTIKKSKKIVNTDFEYSDEWRKEAYKASKKFVAQRLRKDQPSCKIISQGVYNPSRIRYLGGQGYLVSISYTFDCNNNYQNDCSFLVEAYYVGNNTWDMKLEKQKFND